MSLQQNNLNKFPKHLQHVRLQKEEEEEQWISGEELCTEGSSDEENTNDVNKKFKSKPIHLPSKELLQIKMSTMSTLSSTTSTSSSAKESDEENTDSAESSLKSPTQWRPKRGSIKLPNIVEKPLDIEAEIWNTEFEYQEAIKRLKTVQNEINATENNDNEEINLDENDILTLEEDLEKLNKILKDCKQDRINFQYEVCDELLQFSSTSLEVESTKRFHDVFKYKSDSNLDNFQNKNSSKSKFKRKVKPYVKRSCKYIHRRKKMTDVLLNEEERARLKYLLSDIEVEEIDGNNDKNIETIKENKIEKVNSPRGDKGFRPNEEESLSLQKIEDELKTLQEMCDDADLKGKLSEDIYSIDEENREWKAYLKLTEDKFRRINDKINKLREQDDPKEKEVET